MILGITFAFAAAVQPGPLQTYIISQTLTKGWKRTLPAALAPVISDGPIIVLVLFVLTNLPKDFLNVLQIGGGIFLLYLAYCTVKTWQRFDLKEEYNPQSKRQTLFKAAVVNLLNPNPYLGWSLVMGPLLLKGWHESPANGMALLISFYTTIVIGLAVTIFLFTAAKGLGSKTNKLLLGISVIALACFGLYELWSGIFSYLRH